jgi:hypothetical protein
MLHPVLRVRNPTIPLSPVFRTAGAHNSPLSLPRVTLHSFPCLSSWSAARSDCPLPPQKQTPHPLPPAHGPVCPACSLPCSISTSLSPFDTNISVPMPLVLVMSRAAPPARSPLHSSAGSRSPSRLCFASRSCTLSPGIRTRERWSTVYDRPMWENQ